MATATIKVEGLRELQAAFRKISKELSKEMREELRAAGKGVQQEATSLFSSVDARSAAGYKIRVRARGVAIEQSLPRTTGKHAQYGAMQMTTALIPALETRQDEVMHGLERMIDRLGGHNGF